MFQFPALASNQVGWHSFRMPGCPIRKSSDQRSFAPTRSLSQLITSFIASESQGIRHAPLFTFFYRQGHFLWKERNPMVRYILLALTKFTFFCTSCQRSFDYTQAYSVAVSEWRITDSNRWPPACKAGALASWANPPIIQDKISICW